MDEHKTPPDPLPEALPHLERAYAFKAQGDLSNALLECEEANRLAPHWSDAHYLRGVLLESLGRSDEAPEAFRTAAQLDPSLRDPRPGFLSQGPESPLSRPAPVIAAEPGKLVPWTGRDAWWGMGMGLLVWAAIIFGTIFVALVFDVDESIFLSLLLGLGEIFLLIPIWWFTVRKYRVSWGSLGFRSFRGSAIGIGCGMLFVAYIFTVIYALVIVNVLGWDMGTDVKEITEDVSSPGLVTFALVLGAVVVAPFVEEMFFRGFIFAGLRERYGWKIGALTSAGLFTIVHLNPIAIPTLFMLGFAFAFLYHRSNSLWPSILMHAIWNGVVVGASFVGD